MIITFYNYDVILQIIHTIKIHIILIIIKILDLVKLIIFIFV